MNPRMLTYTKQSWADADFLRWCDNGSRWLSNGAALGKSTRLVLLTWAAIGCIFVPHEQLHAQKFEPNYDEQAVPDFELPPVLNEACETASSASEFQAAWKSRRASLLAEFAQSMYGRQPDGPTQPSQPAGYDVSCELVESGSSAGGKALRQQFSVTITTDAGEHQIGLLVFTPKQATTPVPCFLGLNFHGNHTVAKDPEIRITDSWVRNNQSTGASDHKANEAGRGKSASRWPIAMLMDAGLGVATAYYGDIDPDFDDGFENGVHALFPELRPGEKTPDRWGSISAWAWGLSRLLDCLQSEVAEVNGDQVAVIGHSRLGKTALWAGATDERFAAVISNDSGCGGAALSRRAFGETVWRINTSFPHWFCPNFKQYVQCTHLS